MTLHSPLAGIGKPHISALLLVASLALPTPALAQQTWTVAVALQEASSLSDDDASGEDDIYFKARLLPTIGGGAPADCNFIGSHVDDDNNITPGWTCTATVNGAPNTTVQIILQLWEHDSTSADDHFDIHPSPGEENVILTYRPGDFQLGMNVGGWEVPRCAPGAIRLRGFDGDDRAEVVFTVSSSLAGAPNGDTDGDGLLDSQEVCGIDENADGIVDVDLRAMGAKPERKDAFVEIDWMVDNSGVVATQHTHAPWLPAMINAWSEFDLAPVTNPTTGGIPSKSGVALHLDTGPLYDGYAMDFDGNGTVDLNVPTGDLDLDGDGIIDIGALGTLGGGTPGGGNPLAEDAVLTTTGADSFNAGSEFLALKTLNFMPTRAGAFRYSVFAHRYGTAGNGSSGLAEGCAQAECNDFIVSLGGWGRETVDANRNGIPDPGGALLLGPLNLPVDGTVNQHVGTFLHELGHNLALGHGGGDGQNWKPNYLSIMNYLWQVNGLAFDFNGDLIGEALSVDLNRDGVLDLRRFAYSNPALPTLNEGALNEAAGISDANTLTAYSCPTPPGGNRVARGNGAIDWNCNGNNAEVGLVSDITAADGSGTTQLPGFDDWARVANGGLNFQFGISLDQQRQLDQTTRRITPLPGRERVEQQCEDFKTIDFEGHPGGRKIETQYAPLATFLRDGDRVPTIADPAMRAGAPTHSGKNALANRVKKPVPLVIRFGAPQRAVTLYFGRLQAATPNPDLRTRAVLQAFDTNDLSMGEIIVPLPAPAAGVTQLLSAAAIFPDQLMSRIELRYEAGIAMASTMLWTTLPEAQMIDDLTLCTTLKPGADAPPLPKRPTFGDLPVALRVNAVVQRATTPTAGEPGHSQFAEQPLAALPVTIDGANNATDLNLVKPEGTKAKFGAPASFAGATFQHWRYDDTISFGSGNREIELVLLRDGLLTAVYLDERKRPRPPRERPPCDCEDKHHRHRD